MFSVFVVLVVVFFQSMQKYVCPLCFFSPLLVIDSGFVRFGWLIMTVVRSSVVMFMDR